MYVRIAPSKARGVVAAPPSKSAAHRMLICAGLASGERSVISGVAPSQDMLATMDCLRALGANVDYDGEKAAVTGLFPDCARDALLPCRECGSALRFFVPIALLTGKWMTFTGGETLFSRPMSAYEDICERQGIEYRRSGSSLTVCGRLSAGEYDVPGDISSQFVSGLLFALPLLSGDSEIRLTTPLQSRPYVDMTLDALAAFGITARFDGESRIEIPGRQRYTGRSLTVEGDWSNAAFFDALNLLGGSVEVTGLDPDSLQGDRVYTEYFAALREGMPVIDLADCPDLGPVCMAAAAAKNGARFTGTRRLRLKESDRCAAMAEELSKFGVRCSVGEDEMTIFPARLHAPDDAISSHNDHRVAMALSLLATVTGGVIDGAEAVNKSMPDFFERLEKLGIEIGYPGGRSAR